jgi:hypothetical protein
MRPMPMMFISSIPSLNVRESNNVNIALLILMHNVTDLPFFHIIVD